MSETEYITIELVGGPYCGRKISHVGANCYDFRFPVPSPVFPICYSDLPIRPEIQKCYVYRRFDQWGRFLYEGIR